MPDSTSEGPSYMQLEMSDICGVVESHGLIDSRRHQQPLAIIDSYRLTKSSCLPVPGYSSHNSSCPGHGCPGWASTVREQKLQANREQINSQHDTNCICSIRSRRLGPFDHSPLSLRLFSAPLFQDLLTRAKALLLCDRITALL